MPSIAAGFCNGPNWGGATRVRTPEGHLFDVHPTGQVRSGGSVWAGGLPGGRCLPKLEKKQAISQDALVRTLPADLPRGHYQITLQAPAGSLALRAGTPRTLQLTVESKDGEATVIGVEGGKDQFQSLVGQKLSFDRFPKNMHDTVAGKTMGKGKVSVHPHRVSTSGHPRVIDPNPQLRVSFPNNGLFSGRWWPVEIPR